MIKFIDSEKYSLKEICSKDVFGTRILAYFNTYSYEFDFMRFWVQLDENENPVAAISLIDGSMTLTCGEKADCDELSAFIKMIGFSSLQCDRRVMEKLGIKEAYGILKRYQKN